MKCLVMFIFFINLFVVFTENSSGFSETDLEQYEKADRLDHTTIRDSVITSSKQEPSNDSVSVKNINNDSRYWCNKARELNNKVAGARAAHASASIGKNEADQAYYSQYRSQRSSAAAARSTASATLAMASSSLVEAEREKRDFEEDAHRAGIPAGWLRCQFE